MPPQRQKHISQKVGTVVTTPVAEPVAAAVGIQPCQAAPTVVAPRVPAEIFRNRLLVTADVMVRLPLSALERCLQYRGRSPAKRCSSQPMPQPAKARKAMKTSTHQPMPMPVSVGSVSSPRLPALIQASSPGVNSA